MATVSALIASFRNDEDGQGQAEYTLIFALIAIVAIIALIFLGSQFSSILSSVGSSISGPTSPAIEPAAGICPRRPAHVLRRRVCGRGPSFRR